MSYKCDLHVHSWYSDGTMSPQAIVDKYAAEEYALIAVTDHETTAGIKEAQEAGKKAELRVISGLELPTDYQGLELHVLGYYFDPEDKNLGETLDFLAQKRKERNARLLQALNDKGYDLDWEDLYQREGQVYIGKPNFARALVKKGYIETLAQAFAPGKFLEDADIKAIKKYKLKTEEAIDLIRGAGGLAVLAHPCKIKGLGERESAEFKENFRRLLAALKELGLKGLECIYPKNSEAEKFFFVGEAARLHLHVTEGSDFHGERR